jgi:hypothetical protein
LRGTYDESSEEALEANRLCVEHGAACDECRDVLAQEAFTDDELCAEGQRLWLAFLAALDARREA